MQYSTNYNFNLPEGTDLWNYLTQTNPNFTSLDTILKGISDATVTTATEVASGTAHAITRTLPDANVIRFTATSNWVLGDTMTIDGTPVTVVKPNGTNLQTGDYVIGAEVLGVIRATQFTVYLGAPSSLDAADITYDNTGSGLTATDVQDAIDEVNSNLTPVLLWTNPNGSSTFIAQTITLLHNYADFKFLEIFYSQTNGQYAKSIKIRTQDLSCELGDNVITNNFSQLRGRLCTLSSPNQIIFDDNYVGSAGGVGSVNNDLCVPKVIYGYK